MGEEQRREAASPATTQGGVCSKFHGHFSLLYTLVEERNTGFEIWSITSPGGLPKGTPSNEIDVIGEFFAARKGASCSKTCGNAGNFIGLGSLWYSYIAKQCLEFKTI